jgi:transcriptional regulator with XRE-family HTH domain
MGIERSGNVLNAAMATVLDRIRAEQELTYAEIIKRTGLPRRTIGRIFHDERVMDTDQLVKCCAALGVTVSHVVNEAVKLTEQHR